MRTSVLICAGFLAVATAARAEDAPAAAAGPPAAAALPLPDPVRLELARQLFDASGGRQAAEARLDTLYDQMARFIKPWTGQNSADQDGFLDDIKAAMKARVPQLIDASVAAYAEVYTEEELRDYLAWLQSPSGRAITAKSARFHDVLFQLQAPILQSMMSGIMGRIADRACKQAKCTPEDRRQLDELLSRMLSTSRS
jgi:hypothetical protein